MAKLKLNAKVVVSGSFVEETREFTNKAKLIKYLNSIKRLKYRSINGRYNDVTPLQITITRL
mgnify:CR=1 FL=1|tara:strand:+ start:1853 stop:2038 length:186 start_codon:yes stop_codon:yes gene_type:complete